VVLQTLLCGVGKRIHAADGRPPQPDERKQSADHSDQNYGVRPKLLAEHATKQSD